MRICIVYICAYIVFVCIGIYIHTHVHFLCGCNIEARRAFVPCNLRNPYSMFLIKNLYSCFLPYLCSRFALSVPLPFLCLVPLAVRFPKRLRGSFYAVFKRFLSGLFVHAYLCTVSPVSGACRALFEANLPFLGEYRGAPP